MILQQDVTFRRLAETFCVFEFAFGYQCLECIASPVEFQDFGTVEPVFNMISFNNQPDMIELTNRRTVPQIYIGERHIGGYDDLAALDRRGGLDPLLATS